MPIQNSIEVCIKVDGKPLEEYSHPEVGPEKDSSLTRFVEASADKSFSVWVTLHRRYAFHAAPFVLATVSIDDHKYAWLIMFDKKKQKHRAGVLLRPSSDSLGNVIVLDRHTGSWDERSLTFGDLNITDVADVQNSARGNLQLMRSIRVEVFRGSCTLRREPLDRERLMVDPLNELPEQLAKDLFIEKNVKYTRIGSCSAPPNVYNYGPLDGDEGKPYEFLFLYRSKKYLQHLGYIPRSPSPPPDPKAECPGSEETMKMLKRQTQRVNLENLRLKLQLAEFSQCNLTDKATTLNQEHLEEPAPQPGDSGSFGGKRPNHKRKQSAPQHQNEQDDEDDDVVEIPSPPKKQKEDILIDLTED